jgi:hypothetical protein
MPRKRKKSLCCICGWLTGNERNWILRKTRLGICDFCKEDFVLFGISESQFKRAPYYPVEKHHAAPMWHLFTLAGHPKLAKKLKKRLR